MRAVGLCGLLLGLAAVIPVRAQERTLTWAYQSDVATLDPHALNETFTLGFLGNVYEGLTRRGADLRIEPALAQSWEMPEPTRWRFHLRQGVRFHGGEAFTADDVLFSAVRARLGDVKARLAGVRRIDRVDDYTVDVTTEAPNPLLLAEWDTWYIMDQGWAERIGAAAPGSIKQGGNAPAARESNGTGPFKIVDRRADVATTALRNPDWWDTSTGNLDRVVFRPVTQGTTRIAALLSGEVDLAYPIPLQDLDLLRRTPGLEVLVAPEVRTVFFGMDQARTELRYSDVKGANPLRDRRVRLAIYQAIDAEAIRDKIMRGAATPTAELVASGIHGSATELKRYPYDPAASRALLAEAGYPNGFALGLDCPNDRYVNDAAICQAVAAMLAKVGIRVALSIQPRSLFFAKVLGQGGYDTSFFMIGWAPNTFDSWNALFNLAHSRDEASAAGGFNIGGYANPRLDALIDTAAATTDPVARDAMLAQAWRLLHEAVAFIPLHQQHMAWGLRDTFHVTQRPDDQLVWRFVRKD